MPTSAPPSTYQPLSIGYGVRAAADRTPGKVALRCGDQTRRYVELADRIARVTGAIAGLGLGPGDTAAILAPNCLEYLEIVAGVSSAGVAVATINPRLVAREITYTCDDCGARVLFVHPDLEDLARTLTLATVERIVVLGDDYDAWTAAARPRGEVALAEWDPFVIHYTSGTTGEPKGVVLPHRSRVLTFFAMATEYGCYSPDDRYLATAPLFHGAGFAFAMAAIYFGGHCEILPGFDPARLLERLHHGGLTGTFLVPTHFHAMFELEPKILDAHRGISLRTIVSNAAPLPQATKERIVDYFGEGVLHETYGSTEVGIATNLRPADQLRKLECVGLPFVCTRVRLLDDAGVEVGPGEVGELYSTSPYLFNGYWNRPAETAASLRDGWFSAGDLAVRDEEGYIYLVDRKKDMVISGGVNIYPREIEELLYRHEAVMEAAVVGIPDPRWGEALKGYVVRRASADHGPEQLIAYLREHLAGYKVPKSIELIDELPKNAAGKVLKRVLRVRAAATGERT